MCLAGSSRLVSADMPLNFTAAFSIYIEHMRKKKEKHKLKNITLPGFSVACLAEDLWEWSSSAGLPSSDLSRETYVEEVDGQRITFRRRGRSIAAAGPLQQGQGVKDMLAKLQDKYLDVSSFEVEP